MEIQLHSKCHSARAMRYQSVESHRECIASCYSIEIDCKDGHLAGTYRQQAAIHVGVEYGRQHVEQQGTKEVRHDVDYTNEVVRAHFPSNQP